MTDVYADPNAQVTPPLEDGNKPPNPLDVVPDYLADLVGPGKKYASLDAALRSIKPAQEHIAKIQQDNAALAEAVKQSKTIDEVYTTVKDLLQPQERQPGVAIDEAALASLVDSRLVAREAMRSELTNESAFKAEMTKVYGDKQKEVFEKRASELGLSTTELSTLVRRSPTAALELIGIKATAQLRPRSPASGLNTESLPLHSNENLPAFKSVMSGSTTKDVLEQLARHRAMVERKQQE